jgi:hypothetical protein
VVVKSFPCYLADDPRGAFLVHNQVLDELRTLKGSMDNMKTDLAYLKASMGNLSNEMKLGIDSMRTETILHMENVKIVVDIMKTGVDTSISNLKSETNLRLRNVQLMIYPFYLMSVAAAYAFADRFVPTPTGDDQVA